MPTTLDRFGFTRETRPPNRLLLTFQRVGCPPAGAGKRRGAEAGGRFFRRFVLGLPKMEPFPKSLGFVNAAPASGWAFRRVPRLATIGFEVMFLDQPVQGPPADAQRLGGMDLVALLTLQDFNDVPAFDLAPVHRIATGARAGRRAPDKCFRQVIRCADVVLSEHLRPPQ